MKTLTTKTLSLDPDEIKKFSKMADDWWNPNGKFKPLHDLNPVRLGYIRDAIINRFKIKSKNKQVFKGLSLIDIGCGGGLLSEPMARLGAQVTAIDPLEDNIKTAALHAQQNELDIRYLCTQIEEMIKENSPVFDVILNLEVIEHVAHPDIFLKNAAHLLAPGGVMIISTLNRTAISFIKAILGAEYILGWLPKGTHDYNKFLKPEEIKNMLEKQTDLEVSEPSGLSYHPFKRHWAVTQDSSVNFILQAFKPA